MLGIQPLGQITVREGMGVRAELTGFVERVLGRCHVVKDWSWGHGESCVFQLRDTEGVSWYVKRHRHVEQYAREVTAYRRWVPVLGDQAPTFRACDDDLRALVISAIPSSTVTGIDTDVHHQAGALLRRFHMAESFPPWTDIAAHKLAELDVWASRANGLLERRELDFARAELRALGGLAPPRVPCHLDYSPRNWLVANGRVHVIDFEWADPEVWVNDLGRLFFGVWPTRPDLREAFCHGYGRPLGEDDIALLVASYALTAVWHLIWAHEHHQASFATAQRDTLQALMRKEFTQRHPAQAPASGDNHR